MIAFLRRLFSRKPKPVAVDLLARSTGTADWALVKRCDNIGAAHEAAEQHAAEACFKSGNVVFFEFKFVPMFAGKKP